jgi:hypothetical protein
VSLLARSELWGLTDAYPPTGVYVYSHRSVHLSVLIKIKLHRPKKYN